MQRFGIMAGSLAGGYGSFVAHCRENCGPRSPARQRSLRASGRRSSTCLPDKHWTMLGKIARTRPLKNCSKPTLLRAPIHPPGISRRRAGKRIMYLPGMARWPTLLTAKPCWVEMPSAPISSTFLSWKHGVFTSTGPWDQAGILRHR